MESRLQAFTKAQEFYKVVDDVIIMKIVLIVLPQIKKPTR